MMPTSDDTERDEWKPTRERLIAALDIVNQLGARNDVKRIEEEIVVLS
jgi:hypothetical protein